MTTLLFIQPSLTQVGGVEKVVPVIARGLTESGMIEVVGISFYDPASYDPDYFTLYATLAEKPTRSWFDRVKKITRRLLAIKAKVADWQPDAIVVSTPGATLITLLFKKLWRSSVPVFVYVHQSLLVSDTGYLSLTKWLYQSATGFIAVSSGVGAEVTAMFQKPTLVAYNPLGSISVVRTTEPLPSTIPIFITAARLETIRGVDMLVRLMASYFTTQPGELWIFGEGRLRSELETFVSAQGLSSRILFKGVVPDVSPYLASASVYVSCAESEAFGVALVEALRAGLPIVCTDVPYGPREIMQLDLAERLVYPYETSYGVLLPPVPAPVDAQYQALFNQALAVALASQHIPEVVTKRVSRSADFSPEQTIQVIKNFIAKYLAV